MSLFPQKKCHASNSDGESFVAFIYVWYDENVAVVHSNGCPFQD